MVERLPCLDLTLADVERKHILATLRGCDGNRTRAARVLDISIRCLRNKLREYRKGGLRIPEQLAPRTPKKAKASAALSEEDVAPLCF